MKETDKYSDDELINMLTDDESLEEYLKNIEENELEYATNALSQDFSEKVMKKIKQQKTKKIHNTFIYYVSAASITLIITGTGIFNQIYKRPIIYTSVLGTVTQKTSSIFVNGWTDNLNTSISKIFNSIISEKNSKGALK